MTLRYSPTLLLNTFQYKTYYLITNTRNGLKTLGFKDCFIARLEIAFGAASANSVNQQRISLSHCDTIALKKNKRKRKKFVENEKEKEKGR